MVNLVIVSHSSRLGEGVGELARQMLMSDSCKIAIAAGIDDPQNPIGTDAVKVMEAIESVADADHVLVMMDMGSALLSAETALELLAPEIAAKVRLCAAPLVEGTLAATVSAASGADIDKVIFDAMHALEAKREQLGLPSTDRERASSSYGGHVSEISVSEDGKPSCSRLASSACMASKITLSISAPEAALTVFSSNISALNVDKV